MTHKPIQLNYTPEQAKADAAREPERDEMSETTQKKLQRLLADIVPVKGEPGFVWYSGDDSRVSQHIMLSVERAAQQFNVPIQLIEDAANRNLSNRGDYPSR